MSKAGCSNMHVPILQVEQAVEEKKYESMKALYGNEPGKYDDVKRMYSDFITLNEVSQGYLESASMPYKKYNNGPDELISELSMGAYNKFDEFMEKSSLEYRDHIHDLLEDRMAKVVGLWEDPREIENQFAFSEQFLNRAKYLFNTISKPNRTWLGMPVKQFMHKIKMATFFGHIGQAFRQYAPANDMFTKLKEISGSFENQSSMLKQNLFSIIKKHGGMEVGGQKIDSEQLWNLVRFTDPSFSVTWKGKETYDSVKETVNRKLLTEISKMGIEGKENQIQVLDKISAIKKDTDKWMYGDVPEDKRGDKASYFNDDLDKALTTDKGEAHPPFHRYVFTTAERIKDILSGIKKETLNKKEFATLKAFNELFGDGEKSYSPRRNYMPMNKDDDFMSVVNTESFNRLFTNTNIFNHREKIMKSDNFVHAGHALNNNMKIIKQLFTSVLELGVATRIKDQMDHDTKFKETNLVTHSVIDNWATHMIESRTKEMDQPSEFARGVKNWGQALIALHAGVILTGSGIKNRMAAWLYRSGLINPMDYNKMAKQFANAASGQPWEQKLRDEVLRETTLINPMIKLSDELVKEQTGNYEGAIEYGKSILSEKLPDMVKRLGEASINNIFGIIKSDNFAFNNSENKNLLLQRYMLYDRAKLAMQGIMAQDASKNDMATIRKVITELSDRNYALSVQGIGEYSKYAKPFWAWETLRDANTALQVLMGTAMTKYAMFRMVQANNMDLIQRFKEQNKGEFLSILGKGGGTLSTATSTSGLMLQQTALLYELANLYYDDETPLRLYGLDGINPFEEMFTYGGSLKALLDITTNKPISEYEADKLRNFFFLIGSNATGRFSGSDLADGDVTKFIEFPKAYSIDAAQNIVRAIDYGLDSDDAYTNNREIKNNLDILPALGVSRSNKYLSYGADLWTAGQFFVRGLADNDKRLVKQAGSVALGSIRRFTNTQGKINMKSTYAGSDYELDYMIKGRRHYDYYSWGKKYPNDYAVRKKERDMYYALNKLNGKMSKLTNTKYFKDVIDEVGSMYE